MTSLPVPTQAAGSSWVSPPPREDAVLPRNATATGQVREDPHQAPPYLPISTRKLKRIAQDLFGAPVSAGTVSKAAAVLDADLPCLPDEAADRQVVFLFLDGISQKVRELGVEGKVMLCAFGIHTEGPKELLSFRLADVEDTPGWQRLVPLQLVVANGAERCSTYVTFTEASLFRRK